jgi:hypothetical protein
MGKSILLNSFTFIIAFCLISCSNDDSSLQKNSKSVKTRVYSSQFEEAKALALPIDEVNSTPKNIKDKRAAAVILSNYVSIKDSLYSLDISKEDAQKIGVDADLYTSILEDLKNSNKTIKDARQQGEHISLPNIKEEYKKYKQSNKVQQTTTRSGNKGRNQYGSISTNGTEEGTDAFIPTIDKSAVKFTCRTGAAITPIYTCKTHIFGGWNSKTRAGTLFTNTIIIVKLAASGSKLTAKLYFSTTDSNGGYCNWVAIK